MMKNLQQDVHVSTPLEIQRKQILQRSACLKIKTSVNEVLYWQHLHLHKKNVTKIIIIENLKVLQYMRIHGSSKYLKFYIDDKVITDNFRGSKG